MDLANAIPFQRETSYSSPSNRMPSHKGGSGRIGLIHELHPPPPAMNRAPNPATCGLAGALLLALLVPGCADREEPAPSQRSRIEPGMSLDAFLQVHPDLGRPAGPDTQVTRTETRQGLDGTWTYEFEDGKLDWWVWDATIDELNEDNFRKCLEAASALIDEAKATSGSPVSLERGQTAFRDPKVQRHWGYDVVEAKWKADDVWFKISFRFKGAKGMYAFLVKSEFFRPGYEFF
jgi:hypothetical protein